MENCCWYRQLAELENRSFAAHLCSDRSYSEHSCFDRYSAEHSHSDRSFSVQSYCFGRNLVGYSCSVQKKKKKQGLEDNYV